MRLTLLCDNKDTVPPREEDFVAHHFSHNAPNRPYVHCVYKGEVETGRQQEKRDEKQRLVLELCLKEATAVRKVVVIQCERNNR